MVSRSTATLKAVQEHRRLRPLSSSPGREPPEGVIRSYLKESFGYVLDKSVGFYKNQIKSLEKPGGKGWKNTQ